MCSADRPTVPGLSGLANPRGANNCFLNSAVQVLYRLQSFREVFLPAEQAQVATHGGALPMPRHNCKGEAQCLVCSLGRVFVEMEVAEQRSLLEHVQVGPPSI
jgi:hypothetical protein